MQYFIFKNTHAFQTNQKIQIFMSSPFQPSIFMLMYLQAYPSSNYHLFFPVPLSFICAGNLYYQFINLTKMYITQMEPELKIEHSHVPVKIEELPKRVKATSVNSSSKTVKVISNYFPVKIKPFKNIYIFKVIFEPYILHDNRKLRLELLKEALPLMKQQIKNPVIGGMNIYSVSEPEKAETQYLVRQYKISVKLVKNFNVFENPKIMLHFLNNGIRNIMNSLNYIEIGKTGKYFNMSKPNQLNDNLYLYPGHKANFLLAQAGLFLRVDPVNKIVQKKTVLQYIDNLYKSSNSKERQQKRQLVKQALINKIVMTNYGKPRYVKIEDIQFEPLSDVWVDIAHGKSVERLNILDYYMKKYNINVRKSSQPLLVIENKKSKPNQNFQKILMLPELCLMTGLPQDIDEFKRRDISKITIVGPQAKFKSIQEVMRQIKSNQEQNSLAELGIQISSQASKIVAQVIPSPELKLAEKQRVQKGKQSFFNLTSQKLYYSGNKMKVAIIHVQSTSIGSMLDTFQATASKLGLVFDYKVFKIAQKGGRDFELKNNIFQLIERAREMEFNCCIIVLKNSMKNCYQDLKRRCLQEFQIITQIVVEGTLKKKGEKSIHTKILLQIAAKMGNILWQPSIPAIFKERSSMILSFNYSKAGCSKKLVGVGSSDKYFSSYFSESSNLNNNADKFKQMVSIVFKLLNRFIKRNNHLPKQLIILTDSCPKDEIKMLYEHFIPLYNAKMSEISQTNDTKMTIIHATDICNERFFSQRDIGGLDNPTPGLLVSNTIVSENYDFYLVSQKANRGCTVPIHFKVVYSNSALQENVIHELMYSQCFNYFNWTGSIKVPAVMQYAKKFARFCSENLKQNIENDNLVKRLYYI